MMMLSISTLNAQRHNDRDNRDEKRADRKEMRDERRGNREHKGDKKRPQHNDGGRHGRPEKIHGHMPAPSPHAPAVSYRYHKDWNPHVPRHVESHCIHHHHHTHEPIVVREHIHYIPVPVLGMEREETPWHSVSTRVLINIPEISSSYESSLHFKLPSNIKVFNEYDSWGKHKNIKDVDIVIEPIQIGVDEKGKPMHAIVMIDTHAIGDNVIGYWEFEDNFFGMRWYAEKIMDNHLNEMARIIKDWDRLHMVYVR